MESRVFLDTDVIIDFLIDRQPHSDTASRLFDLAEKKKVNLCTSSLCINNIHYIIRKFFSEKKSRSIIEELLVIIEIASVSKEEITKALKSNFKDFEDAIQHEVAIKDASVRAIITRNGKDFKRSRISVLSPEAFIRIWDK